MVPAFTFFPPEINSALMFGGAGPGPLFAAASAWDGLAADLSGAASSFHLVTSELADGAWLGPASVSMTAAATPYVRWLNAAAEQAEAAAAQAREAAAAFESASAATVPTPAVYANRARLIALIATNFLGQNTPAIAMTELEYVEMWAQDVAAMLGYHWQATSLVSTLPQFSVPPRSLVGLAGLLTTPLANVAHGAGQGAGQGAPALASATNLATNARTAVADSPVRGLQPLGGLGAASAGLGQARFVGAISVPPTWEGAMPAPIVGPAMSSFGSGTPTAPATPGAARPGGMAMPVDDKGAQGGKPDAMMRRGGPRPAVVRSRPRVLRRTEVSRAAAAANRGR